MTIGIGVLCANRRYILLCSDTRSETGRENKPDVVNDLVSKIVPLAPDCYACTAFSLNVCESVASSVRIALAGNIKAKGDLATLMEIFRQAHGPLHEQFIDTELQKNLGITRERFLQANLGSYIYSDAREIISQCKLQAQMIVASFSGTEPILLKYIGQDGSLRPQGLTGMSVIGIEDEKAHQHLCSKGKQSTETDLCTSFINMYAAKRHVECSSIGPGTDFVLLSSKGSRRLESNLIDNWDNQSIPSTENQFHKYFGTEELIA